MIESYTGLDKMIRGFTWIAVWRVNIFRWRRAVRFLSGETARKERWEIMQYTTAYMSPLGKILLAGDQAGLTGLWFAGQKYYGQDLDAEHEEREIPVLTQTKKWLDLYFSGKVPDFVPQLHFTGSDFQKEVWEILLTIPYGKTMTYGEIAAVLAKKSGLAHISAQAIGGAVGRNEISVIVPCHRVVGADGSLTGYAGGLDKKIWLLTMEGAGMDALYRPQRGTAL